MKNIPKVIYLQVFEDGESCDDFNELVSGAVSWCSDRINKSDIRYVLDKKVYNERLIDFLHWYRRQPFEYIEYHAPQEIIKKYLKTKL